MVSYLIVLVVGVLLSGMGLGAIFFLSGQGQGDAKAVIKELQAEIKKKSELKKQIETLYSGMVDVGSLKQFVVELIALQESLKAERGRITITQAELETVETRLRELEEIERELEASGLETKEELNILQKKQDELRKKNDNLKGQIAASKEQIDQLLGEIEMTSQMQEQIATMQSELLSSEKQIDELLIQIEDGNEQYFIMKKRYDALDIEYAQLYEKFSEAEGGGD